MTTRLDRLFLLLETGSTPAIRKSAAEQLGEVQKLHPHELNNLLSKVHLYLGSSNWDTRIAAGHAVEAIAKNVAPWQPRGACKKEEEDSNDSECGYGGQLTFSRFDISKVIAHAGSLLGSEGAEYDVAEETLRLDQKENLAQQRQLLNKRLGLDVAGGLGFGGEDLFKEEDLIVHTRNSDSVHNSVADVVNTQFSGGLLSARERNRAKRKAKLLARTISRDDGSDSEPACKRLRRDTESPVNSQDWKANISTHVRPDLISVNTDVIEEWPFDAFCELLMSDLFHASWEKRHGAAIGLRHVVRLHGAGAGKSDFIPSNQLEVSNGRWLDDLSLRLICVLGLDRFGDYVSDEVVAPIRESCAQTLGVTLHHMSARSVHYIISVLLQLLNVLQWEVRHGGLLGIKYLLAVRQDLVESLLPMVVPSIYISLQDRDDDVRAVAAAALLPTTDTLVTKLLHQVKPIVDCLWYTLTDLDDLTASTNSIMMLLSALLSHPLVPADFISSQTLTELVPRLWPFLRHTISSVRKASLQTLLTLLSQKPTDATSFFWLLPILQDALRHIYQRVLLENKKDVLELVHKVWCTLLAVVPREHLLAASVPWLGVWFCLMMQPSQLPFDQNLLIEAKHQPKEQTPSRVRYAEHQQMSQIKTANKDYIGGAYTKDASPWKRDEGVIQARLMAARLCGELCRYLSEPLPTYPEGMEPPPESLSRLLLFHLNTKSAIQRFCVGLVVKEWANVQQPCLCPMVVKEALTKSLCEVIYFDEIAVAFTRMQTECRDFIASLKQQGMDMDLDFPTNVVLTFEKAEDLCTTTFSQLKSKLPPRQIPTFETRAKQLVNTVTMTTIEQNLLTMRVQSTLAGAVTSLQYLPEKLNPVIRPLMDAIKKEENLLLQTQHSGSLSRLLLLCVSRTPCPNPKVIKNLCTILCSDPTNTPLINQPTPSLSSSSASSSASSLSKSSSSTSLSESVTQSDALSVCDKYSGILTLNAQQKAMERTTKRGPGRPKANAYVEISIENLTQEENEGKRQLLVQRRGSILSLTMVAKDVGLDMPTSMSHLWQMISNPPAPEKDDKKTDEDDAAIQEMINSLQVLETVGPVVHTDLIPKLVAELSTLCSYLQHSYTAVRHMAARSISMLGRIATVETMDCILETMLPLMGASDSDTKRQGAIEVLANMIDTLSVDIVPYIVLLVVPVLGRMSDQDASVRLMASHCFATLIRLMPLEAGIPDPPNMKSNMVEKKEQERRFLEQLINPTKVDNYHVPVPINAELRKYQQDGVNWLAFLNKYKLHGILCDDMGLGKTLQSICILAGDHHNRAEQYKKSKSDDSAPLSSMVVCPPTLTGHWVYEIEKFISSDYLNPLHYTGTPSERTRLQKKVKKHNLIVASYDVVRNDINFFSKIKWNYCILDEGHIIKNSKTKLSRAIRQLSCNHRLILSGTPIQNNVLELWSLFDFLMPGFLGTERQFQARFGRPIIQSREAKSSSKEQEAGALAMEALHRQVLPFLLRRMKEDVLNDLPPKIIQDYYCELSPLQIQLYEDFSKSRAKKSVEESISSNEKKVKTNSSHIFQALQYLRKLCNHPALVMKSDHPEYQKVSQQLKSSGTTLRDLQHAPKLTALKQLLYDCGIGVSTDETSDQPVVNQHRVLLFCQLRSMLDIVENDLFKSHMPSVTYLRLDGSVAAGSRHGIVNRFNNDPSIDVLLLSTHVGGLGLNLTGADTVIFVEHDWNPMKDLQAMDRAHRIGQKKVVNVYRLITRGTLEEKIMGLQKFKLNIANTVITQDNSSLTSMATGQVLDLFSVNSSKDDDKKPAKTEDKGQTSMKNVLENLEELWEEDQYETEYDLGTFMTTLAGNKTDA